MALYKWGGQNETSKMGPMGASESDLAPPPLVGNPIFEMCVRTRWHGPPWPGVGVFGPPKGRSYEFSAVSQLVLTEVRLDFELSVGW